MSFEMPVIRAVEPSGEPLLRVLGVTCPLHGDVTTQTWWKYWNLNPATATFNGAAVPFDQYGWEGRVTTYGIRSKPGLQHQEDCGAALLWATEPALGRATE